MLNAVTAKELLLDVVQEPPADVRDPAEHNHDHEDGMPQASVGERNLYLVVETPPVDRIDTHRPVGNIAVRAAFAAGMEAAARRPHPLVNYKTVTIGGFTERVPLEQSRH